MKPLVKGVLLAVLQLAILLSLAGKMLYDRATRPRVWVKAESVNPNVPLRGRYASLRLEVHGQNLFVGSAKENRLEKVEVELRVENDQLIVAPSDRHTGNRVTPAQPPSTAPAVLFEPVAYFIPEHIPDPSRRAQGEELWVEVTVPKKGPPRPIRLGVSKDGKLTLLEIN